MNFINYFIKNEYDNNKFLRKNGKDFSVLQLKKIVAGRVKKFIQSDVKNVVLLPDSNFDFIINFFAAIFAKKEIYLVNDKTRLNQLDVEFILPENEIIEEENFAFFDVNLYETFINIFTSGSTSSPKKIRKNLYNLYVEAKDMYEQFFNKTPKNYSFVSTTNFTHMFGIVFSFVMPACYGYIIDTDKVDFPEELDLKENYVLISTPSFLDRIIDYDLKNYPFMISTAGAKLKQKTFEFFEKKSHVLEIYGSTETGSIAYQTNSKFNNLILLENVKIIPDAEIMTVMSEYFLEDKMTISDAFEMINEREFVLKNRTDRIVKIMEKRISLNEIEMILNKHNFIKDNYSFALNEKLCSAVVLSKEGKEYFLKFGKVKLLKEIKTLLKNYSEILPKRWKFLYEIPTTTTGKIDREKIKKIFELNLSYPFIVDKKVTKDFAELKLIFPQNCNFFDGHFNNFPILPGVVQLFYANYFIEDIFKLKLELNEVKKIKFSNIIRPDIEICLRLKNNDKSIEYTYLSDDKNFSSGIFVK